MWWLQHVTVKRKVPISSKSKGSRGKNRFSFFFSETFVQFLFSPKKWKHFSWLRRHTGTRMKISLLLHLRRLYGKCPACERTHVHVCVCWWFYSLAWLSQTTVVMLNSWNDRAVVVESLFLSWSLLFLNKLPLTAFTGSL